MVAGNWRNARARNGNALHHGISGAGNCRRCVAHERETIFIEQVALGRCRAFGPDLLTESDLAGAAPIYLARLSGAHSRDGRTTGPHRWIPAAASPALPKYRDGSVDVDGSLVLPRARRRGKVSARGMDLPGYAR